MVAWLRADPLLTLFGDRYSSTCGGEMSKVIWQEAASPVCYPLAAANALVRRVRWTGGFACVRYTSMGRRMLPPEVPIFMGDLDQL